MCEYVCERVCVCVRVRLCGVCAHVCTRVRMLCVYRLGLGLGLELG